MAHYIDKSALVAEIEKKIIQYEVAFNNPSFASYEASLIAKGKYRKLLDIRQFIDTLEVKEVDSLSLTWEDMLTIHKCIKDATNYHLSAFQTVEGQQKIYEDVLKRFKAQKGK